MKRLKGEKEVEGDKLPENLFKFQKYNSKRK